MSESAVETRSTMTNEVVGPSGLVSLGAGFLAVSFFLLSLNLAAGADGVQSVR